MTPRNGSWPIWIATPTGCTGGESSIEDCLHKREDWYHSNICNHHEDVVLTCKVRVSLFNPVCISNVGVPKDAEMSDNIVSDVSPKISKLQAVDLQVVEECGLWRKLDNRYLVNEIN